MNPQVLNIQENKAVSFEEFAKHPRQVDNLFVITHLGQLKQMEALIRQKGIDHNLLVVLHTIKNVDVPSNVINQASEDLFDGIVYLEIPFGINKPDLQKLKWVEKRYKALIGGVDAKSLYLNSFEGHYVILVNIARSKGLYTVLVEEGTATYKLNLDNTTKLDNDTVKIEYKDVKKHFMDTIGQTQIFKKGVKYYKYQKELAKQTKGFCQRLVKDSGYQTKMIEWLGGKNLKSSLQPFKGFDKAYVSFPELIKDGFGIHDVEKFSVHGDIDEQSILQAQSVISEYQITENDVLYVSQRYAIDAKQYAAVVSAVLLEMTDESQRVFIKLHPKEGEKVYQAFKSLAVVSGGKFVLIENNQFLIEPVIKVSKIGMVAGLTSTALVYAPLVSPTTEVVSIAPSVIKQLSRLPANQKGLSVIKEHLDIIRVFDNIRFV